MVNSLYIFLFKLTIFIVPILSVERIYAQTGFAVGEAKQTILQLGILSNGNEEVNRSVENLLKDLKYYQHLLVAHKGSKDKNRDHFLLEASLKGKEMVWSLSRSQVSTAVKQMFSMDLRKDRRQEERKLAHFVITQTTYLTNSIFLYNLVFVSEMSESKPWVKEIFEIDFDGQNLKQLTHDQGTIISPAVSYQGDQLIYSLIPNSKGKRNMKLQLVDMNTQSKRLLFESTSIHSGACFSQDGQGVYFTVTSLGQGDIFYYNLSDKGLKRITTSKAEDVDPFVSADGRWLTFLSDRPGKAMIYQKDLLKDTAPVRLSFVGKFNATPRYSPDGQWIVFSSWVDQSFDIYRLNVQKLSLDRLTKNFGSNEEPLYSPDSEFIIFTSQRVLSPKNATQDVYMMTNEGKFLRKFISIGRKIYSPKWRKVL